MSVAFCCLVTALKKGVGGTTGCRGEITAGCTACSTGTLVVLALVVKSSASFARSDGDRKACAVYASFQV